MHPIRYTICRASSLAALATVAGVFPALSRADDGGGGGGGGGGHAGGVWQDVHADASVEAGILWQVLGGDPQEERDGHPHHDLYPAGLEEEHALAADLPEGHLESEVHQLLAFDHAAITSNAHVHSVVNRASSDLISGAADARATLVIGFHLPVPGSITFAHAELDIDDAIASIFLLHDGVDVFRFDAAGDYSGFTIDLAPGDYLLGAEASAAVVLGQDAERVHAHAGWHFEANVVPAPSAGLLVLGALVLPAGRSRRRVGA